MSISFDGTSLVWDGTVTITNFTDPTTGVVTLTLTPNGGVGSLPALVDGTPGLPPVIDSISVNQIAWNATPAAPVVTLVSAGGPGVASHYTIEFEVNQGEPGEAGSFTIGSATDLEGTETDQYIIKYVAADSKWKIVAELCGNTYNTTTFTAASGNSSPQTLGTITIPAQPYGWVPRVSGLAVPTGTANTHVDLAAYITSPTTGQQVGYGLGVTGAGSGSIPAFPVKLDQAFGGSLSAGYGQVAKGTGTTVYFCALQTATTADDFSVPTTNMYFSVKVDPIPGTS